MTLSFPPGPRPPHRLRTGDHVTAGSLWRRLGDVVLHTGPMFNQLDAALARVLELHCPFADPVTGRQYCGCCHDDSGYELPYPCPTIRALEEQP